MARCLSLLAVLSLVSYAGIGCGETPSSDGPALRFDPCAPLAIVADPAATPAQGAGIAAAVALWNLRARSQLMPMTATAPAEMPALPVHFQRAAAAFHGLYDPATGQLFINDDLVGQAQVVTIAHEIGHAFGLSHVSSGERVSVMNPENLLNEPTSADIDALATDWGYCP